MNLQHAPLANPREQVALKLAEAAVSVGFAPLGCLFVAYHSSATALKVSPSVRVALSFSILRTCTGSRPSALWALAALRALRAAVRLTSG